jgi:CheY-like chemotaxis protein
MITVKSDVGRGSTFDLFLPLCDKEIRQEEIPEQKLVRGAETVLLVDDEEMIRDVAASMLEKIGYRVIVSSSGEEAVDVVTGSGESIQIVVLDMIMPGMDGGETFDRIRALQPRIPVLLSSGYTIDGQATEILNRGCNGFIQKPFNLSELSTKIREILDSR